MNNSPIGKDRPFTQSSLNIDSKQFDIQKSKEFKTTVEYGGREVNLVKAYTPESKWGRIKNLFGLAVAIKDADDKTVVYVNKQSVINHHNKELLLSTKTPILASNCQYLNTQVSSYQTQDTSTRNATQAMAGNVHAICQDTTEMVKTLMSSTEVNVTIDSRALLTIQDAKKELERCILEVGGGPDKTPDPKTPDGKLLIEIQATIKDINKLLRSRGITVK